MPILRGASFHQQRISHQKYVPVHQKSSSNNNHHHHHRHSAMKEPNPETIIRMSNPRKIEPLASEYKGKGAFQALPMVFYEARYAGHGHYYNPNYPDFPWPILTLIRFIQLVETNIAIYMFTKNDELLTYLKLPNAAYVVLVFALAFQFVAWLMEENVVRRIYRGNSAGVLCGLITISFSYTICCSVIGICLHAYCNNKQLVTLGVTLLSVLYFVYHLHWISKSVRVTLAIEEHQNGAHTINFNNTTRPGTHDTRLNIGPHLVFPKPEEYSVPE